MFKYLLAASALALVSTPAAARDGAAYVGIEGGGIFFGGMDFDLSIDDGVDEFDYDDGFEIDLSPGYDLDLIAGMDFGMIRGEVELGRKRLNISEVDLDDEVFEDLELDTVSDFEGLKSRANTIMGNVLFDAINSGGTSVYVGGGVGRASVKLGDAKDRALAWQLIAGVRAPITDMVEAGVKYRFFNTGNLKFSDTFGDDDFVVGASGKLRTHSLLASLIFNFGGVAAPVVAVPAPVVAAPEAPATQTCPDGSVILATDVCPAPPPPPAAPGERG